MTIPSNKNICGGGSPDTVLVKLLDGCNGCCEFCCERNSKVNTNIILKPDEILRKLNSIGRKKVSLLGGEPGLYPYLQELIALLACERYEIGLTTNGLAFDFLGNRTLRKLRYCNVSVNHYDICKRKQIQGYIINDAMLAGVSMVIPLRLNCVIYRNGINSAMEIRRYIDRMNELLYSDPALKHSIKFSEVGYCDKSLFIDLGSILPIELGTLSDNPFVDGCQTNKIDPKTGLVISLRQMCGVVCRGRKTVDNPEFRCYEPVLYPNGTIYDGWQNN